MPEVLSLYNGEDSESSHMQEKYEDVQTLSARIYVYPIETYGFTFL